MLSVFRKKEPAIVSKEWKDIEEEQQKKKKEMYWKIRKQLSELDHEDLQLFTYELTEKYMYDNDRFRVMEVLSLLLDVHCRDKNKNVQ